MAIDPRIRQTFTSDKGTFYRITIIDTLSSTSSLYTDIEIASDGFQLTYETEDDNRFTGLIPSACKFSFFITNNSGGGNPVNINGILNSIRNSDYGRWQLLIEYSTTDSGYTTFWAGNLLNELNNELDQSFPTLVELTAICGLAQLKNIPFNNVINYSTFSTPLSPFRYIRQTIIEHIGTQNNWATNDILIRTVIDWTNSLIPRNAATDPLVFSKFKSSAYAPINENGDREPKDNFKLLDDICKVFGARLFLSNGKWQIIQVNTYFNMYTTQQFFRDYKKDNAFPHTTPDASGTYQSDAKTIGFGQTIRYNGDFDELGILKEVNIIYDTIKSYDLTPAGRNIVGDGGTNLAVNNALVAWNGYHDGDSFKTDSNIYGINDSTTNFNSFNLGSVTQGLNQSIKIKRLFANAFNGTQTELAALISGQPGNLFKIRFYHRLKIDDGAGNVRYSRSTYTINGVAPWTSSDIFGNAPVYHSADFATGLFFSQVPTFGDTSDFTLEFETQEIPISGTLFFECYARIFGGYLVQNQPESSLEMTGTSQNKFFIYSAPENSDDQILQLFVNGSQTSQRKFVVTQNITSGLTFSMGEVFFGSGPNSAADGALLSSADGTNFDDGTNETWVAYGSGTGKNILSLLIDEVLKGQNDGAKIFNGSIKILTTNVGTDGYKFNNSIKIDNVIYLPYQCTFNANSDTWEGQWYQVNVGSPTLTTSIVGQAFNNGLSLLSNSWQ